MARLILEHSSKVLKDFPFAKRSLTIGRHSDNTIVLDDPGVSGFHARIDKRGVDYILTDLQSTNGTFLNDVNIVSHKLTHGDRIMVGEHVILFIGTEMSKAYAEEEKLDLNATTITSVSRKTRASSKPGSRIRPKISATKHRPSRFPKRIVPVLLGIFIFTGGGWYIFKQKPVLLKRISSALIRTDVIEAEHGMESRYLSKIRSNEAESASITKKASQKSGLQLPDPSESPVSGKDLFVPISLEDEETSSYQNEDEYEGMGQTAFAETDEPEYVLEGIVWASEPKDCFAVINGRMVRAGGSVEGATIMEITKRHVLIRFPKDDSEVKLTLR